MNKLSEKFRALFTPVAVMLLVVAVAVMTPLASLVGAVRVMAESSPVHHTLNITNLPARYAKLNDPIEAPTVTNGSSPVSAELWHANRKIYVTNDSSSSSTNQTHYNEVGKYEWRFYLNGNADSQDGKPTETPFDTYVVWVTQDEYAMTMPSVVPTVAPKSLTELALPLPEKITWDGKDITEEVFGTAEEENKEDETPKVPYTFFVKASMGPKTITSENGEDNDEAPSITIGDKVVINMNKFGRGQIADLKVTYMLKQGNKILVAKVLNDIAIKDVKVEDVTFANNPTAPSVAALKYKEPLELTAPTMPNAKYDNSSFAVEAETTIVAVKYSESQPNDWNKVNAMTVKDGKLTNDTVEIDGLKITALQLGWYKFQFSTDTLFGHKTEATDDEDGIYWSDAVHVSQDSTAPEFKWVKRYEAEDGAAMSKNFDEIDDKDLYDKYLPMTSKPTQNSASTKITVRGGSNGGIVFPAIIARDNGTKYEDLRYSVSVTQQTDSQWNSLTTTGNTASINSEHNSYPYKPNENLTINFSDSATQGDAQGNEFTMANSAGLYQVTFRVTETQPKYPNGDKSAGYDHPVTKTYYFWVETDDEKYTVENPTIGSFAISDVYLWEGSTFDFILPTFSDRDTTSSNIETNYYLIKASDDTTGDSSYDSTKAYLLDKDNIANGRLTVDLLDSKFGNEFKSFKGELKIYAVARNFTALQAELKSPDTASFTFNPNAAVAGVTYRSASFKVHQDESASTSANKLNSVAITAKQNDQTYGAEGVTFKSGTQIDLTSISATWKSDADGKISVSVYRLKDNKRSAVKLYNQNNEVVSTMLYNKKEVTINNWHFMPDSGATYQVVVMAKENASSTAYYEVFEYQVQHSGTWQGSPVGASNVSPMAVTSASATTTVGTSIALLDWQGVTPDEKYIVAKNRLIYAADADYNITNPITGDNYTITVKGVNDPNCVSGNKFTPNYTGTYKFEYTFYYTINGKQDSYVMFNYNVTVTDATTEAATMQLDEAYNEYVSDEAVKDNTVGNVLFLEEFMLANRGGAMNFTVNQETLRKALNQKEIENSNPEAEKKYYYTYPAIAIPMPNVLNGGVSSDDIEITVQKSGSSDYLVSSKKANINGNRDSVLDKVNGYYVFRPDGKFSSNKEDFMTENSYEKNDTSGVYIVTYTMPDGTAMVYNLTIGDPVVGTLTFEDGFLTYQNSNKTVNIDKNNTNPVIDKNSDGKRLVTIDMSKITYMGNTNFWNLMRKGVDDATKNEGKTEDELMQLYIFEHATVSVIKDGTTLINSWEWTKDEKDEDAMTYTFAIEGSGTYRVEVNLSNPYMNSYNAATQSFEFTIDTTATNKNVNLNTVWGIILIILSIGLLAGVVFYFVKTARETKFLDAPKAPKKNKKDTTKTKAVKDEKVEDQK